MDKAPARILSKDNRLLKDFRKLARSADYRREQGRFLCEGRVMLEEALRERIGIDALLYDEERPPALAGCENIPLYCCPKALLDGLSQVESPQGLLFSCKTDLYQRELPSLADKPILLLDRLSDPGNLGTVLRTADAFGYGVLLGQGSADPTAPKVVRSTMGSLFRVPAALVDAREALLALRAAGKRIYAAVLDENARPPEELEAFGEAVVIVGNEARGVSEELVSLSDGGVRLAMSGRSESLNAAVAAALLMWEGQRARGKAAQ